MSAVTPIADKGGRNCGGSPAASARQSFAVIERPYGITARIIPANSKPATDAVVKMISEIKVTILSPKVIFPLPSSPEPQKTARCREQEYRQQFKGQGQLNTVAVKYFPGDSPPFQ
jgi:hypothetical protein